jgi:phospholipid/cholesterol/gamma-HCH transport system permease protein
MSITGFLDAASVGDHLEVKARGAWVAPHAATLEQVIHAVVRRPMMDRKIVINAADLIELDTYGAWLLERLVRDWTDRGGDVRVIALPDRYRELVAEVHTVNRRKAKFRPKLTGPIAGIEFLGRRMEGVSFNLVGLVAMLGSTIDSVVRIIQRPKSFRLASAVNQLDRVGWQAVPIIFLITFLIGGIIAQQGIFHFRKFGADDYVVDLVGILVLREFGVLIVAIMVAGRSGSSFTAELGSMKMREEIDALRTMGLNPVEVLMLPRITALVCALPILTFLGSMSALFGAGLIAWLYGGMSPTIFLSRLREVISVTHFEVGMIKAPFMALVIGIVACCEGFRVQGSAESLGLHTTTSVVNSIFLVIVLDGLFAIFFASVGM